jgi:glutamine amidotransferase
MEVLVIDYGAGNLTSVLKALRVVGATPAVGSGAAAISRARAIVVPGVGHFAQTASIDEETRTATRGAIARDVPVLGICLGLQWLFEGSAEAPDIAGLGIFPGKCFLLGTTTFVSGNSSFHFAQKGLPRSLKVPHVGWNTLDIVRSSRLLDGLPSRPFAYFTHSYAAPIVTDTVATTSHAGEFTSVIESGRVFGAQWHPEKSGDAGLRVLRNFLNITAGAR